MANEITYGWNLKVANGVLADAHSRTNKKQTQTNARKHDDVQDIPTTAAGTALTTNPSMTALGEALIENLDSTNYIEIGIQNGGTFFPTLRLNAGVSKQVTWAQGIALYARANTATVKFRHCTYDA